MVIGDELQIGGGLGSVGAEGLGVDLEGLWRRKVGRELLVRAMGGRGRRVVDATAGWGVDAVALARAGFGVVAVERNRVVAEAVRRAYGECTGAWRERLRFVWGDGVEYLRGLGGVGAEGELPDVVYLDPMLGDEGGAGAGKSAARKKPMAVLRELVGGDEGGCEELFAVAMRCARLRVVVKRPRRAAAVHANKVGEVRGKLVRFDLYQPWGEGG